MEELLLNRKYVKIDDEFKKGIWTIRLDGDFIEIFNSPIKEIGKYYYGPIANIDIKFLLDTIDDMC